MPRGFAGSKVDKNHLAIVQALRRCGWYVISLAPLGGGVPDILVVSKSDHSRVLLMEIKSPGGKLTDQEKLFFAAYPGRATIVYSPEGAVENMSMFEKEVDE